MPRFGSPPTAEGCQPPRRLEVRFQVEPGEGAERESASWESGNLGSRRAFADSPGCQDSRFSVPRPGGDLGGRDWGRGWVRAATWRTGNLEPWESARRGARWVDAGPPLPGVPAWGALGRRPWPPPWPGGARPSRAPGRGFACHRSDRKREDRDPRLRSNIRSRLFQDRFADNAGCERSVLPLSILQACHECSRQA